VRRGNFIAVNKETAEILTSGQSIYAREDSARRGIGQWIRKDNREKYVIVEITTDDVRGLLERNGFNADDN